MTVRTIGRVAAAIVAFACAVVVVPAAVAADAPKTPQPVAEYFAEGLIPRLIDLYGSGNGVTKGVDFDATTKVGAISRVREWTPDFLAGHATSDPTRLTNNWVAPVSVRGDVLGLATVWINPTTNEPELASFDSAELAREIAAAPKDASLVHDAERGAWFAEVDDSLVTLVPGTSGITGTISTQAYQRLITTVIPTQDEKPTGVAIAALVLGIVILGVAIFVLLPVKRTKSELTELEGDTADEAVPVLDGAFAAKVAEVGATRSKQPARSAKAGGSTVTTSTSSNPAAPNTTAPNATAPDATAPEQAPSKAAASKPASRQPRNANTASGKSTPATSTRSTSTARKSTSAKSTNAQPTKPKPSKTAPDDDSRASDSEA